MSFFKTAQEARQSGLTWDCYSCDSNQEGCDCENIFDYRSCYGEYLDTPTSEIPYKKYVEICLEINRQSGKNSPEQQVIDSAQREYCDCCNLSPA